MKSAEQRYPGTLFVQPPCTWEIKYDSLKAGLVEDAIEKYEDYFPGHNPIPMNKVINGYKKSVEGKGTGEIIRMYDNS